jgi:hypothetical protein
MKWVKGVEDLNICIIGAQGIVGVGAIIRTCIASYQVVASLPMERDGLHVDRASSYRNAFSRACTAACFCKNLSPPIARGGYDSSAIFST